jgi:hypothetical protein
MRNLTDQQIEAIAKKGGVIGNECLNALWPIPLIIVAGQRLMIS